jgi:hypothetical protein
MFGLEDYTSRQKVATKKLPTPSGDIAQKRASEGEKAFSRPIKKAGETPSNPLTQRTPKSEKDGPLYKVGRG